MNPSDFLKPSNPTPRPLAAETPLDKEILKNLKPISKKKQLVKEEPKAGDDKIYVLAFYINGARILSAFRKIDWSFSGDGKLKEISGDSLSMGEYETLKAHGYSELEFLRLDFTKMDKIDTITVIEVIDEI